MTIWFDGAIVPEAKVSIFDHGLLYGDGVFEGMRMEGRAVFRIDDHLRRFGFGMNAIGLSLPGGLDRAREAILATCRAHEAKDAYLRLVVTRGVGELGVDPTNCKQPSLFCIASTIALYPAEKLRKGLDAVTATVRKPGPDALDPRVKSLNYMNSVLAKREAKLRGADEAFVLNARGTLAEASAANVFVVRQGKLLTPPTADGALEGITRRSVLELASRLGIAAEERSLLRADVLDADECFVTGTGARIVPVGSFDGVRIGSGERPVMSRLLEAFPAFVREHGTPVDG